MIRFDKANFDNLSLSDLYSVASHAALASDRQAKEFFGKSLTFRNPVQVYQKIGIWCMYRAWELEALQDGKIDVANGNRRVHEIIYNNLPDRVKWPIKTKETLT